MLHSETVGNGRSRQMLGAIAMGATTVAVGATTMGAAINVGSAITVGAASMGAASKQSKGAWGN